MNYTRLLERKAGEIIFEANSALSRMHLRHYEKIGLEESRQRLETLYDFMLTSIKDKNLMPVIEYIKNNAKRRFASGYDLYEVQTAINVLEEVIWRQIFENLKPEEYSEAIGLVSTVLGAAKDALAQKYVSLASDMQASSMDLLALFNGVDSGAGRSIS